MYEAFQYITGINDVFDKFSTEKTSVIENYGVQDSAT